MHDNSENPFDKQFDLDLKKMEEDPIEFLKDEGVENKVQVNGTSN